MDEQTVELAARAHAQSIIDGDLGTTVRSMTPDGLAKAVEVGNSSWSFSSYELTAHEQDGDDHLFDIAYQTDLGPMLLRDRFRLIDGVWKVVDVVRVD